MMPPVTLQRMVVAQVAASALTAGLLLLLWHCFYLFRDHAKNALCAWLLCELVRGPRRRLEARLDAIASAPLSRGTFRTVLDLMLMRRMPKDALAGRWVVMLVLLLLWSTKSLAALLIGGAAALVLCVSLRLAHRLGFSPPTKSIATLIVFLATASTSLYVPLALTYSASMDMASMRRLANSRAWELNGQHRWLLDTALGAAKDGAEMGIARLGGAGGRGYQRNHDSRRRPPKNV